eukprot:Selendium_serpulae@DN11406_c0_g1_i1.p1
MPNSEKRKELILNIYQDYDYDFMNELSYEYDVYGDDISTPKKRCCCLWDEWCGVKPDTCVMSWSALFIVVNLIWSVNLVCVVFFVFFFSQSASHTKVNIIEGQTTLGTPK